ncbi:MAG: hypothetical protein M1269_12565 [Chloroflexi bacterium]|nr:hypothetical protein [Chloroflexota bacterium]
MIAEKYRGEEPFDFFFGLIAGYLALALYIITFYFFVYRCHPTSFEFDRLLYYGFYLNSRLFINKYLIFSLAAGLFLIVLWEYLKGKRQDSRRVALYFHLYRGLVADPVAPLPETYFSQVVVFGIKQFRAGDSS